MIRKISGRVRWWMLLVLIFAGIIGYFIISEMKRGSEMPPMPQKSSTAEPEAAFKERTETAGEGTGITGDLEKGATKASKEEDDCAQTAKDLAEFFSYLDGKDYIRYLDPEADTRSRFKKILKRLASRPPVPAGEGIDPKIIIRNVYHFFRVLDRKDLRLIRELTIHEQDSLEIDMEMLYRWLILGDSCPGPVGIGMPFQSVYRYAGFFLNTIGGRAYLSRRPSNLRLLVNYYCILIVHTADRIGKNNYGIDILPFIAPLRDEIGHYSELQFIGKYTERLNDIESYYLKRR
jgi:hypothetical protein